VRTRVTALFSARDFFLDDAPLPAGVVDLLDDLLVGVGEFLRLEVAVEPRGATEGVRRDLAKRVGVLAVESVDEVRGGVVGCVGLLAREIVDDGALEDLARIFIR